MKSLRSSHKKAAKDVTFAVRSTNLPRRTKSRASSRRIVSSSKPSTSLMLSCTSVRNG